MPEKGEGLELRLDQIRYSMTGELGAHRFSASGEFSFERPAPADVTGTT